MKRNKKVNLLKQGAPLLLICLPEVIKNIGVHHAFLIIDDRFHRYYFT